MIEGAGRRFEVRPIDHERRVFCSPLASSSHYAEACLVADVFRFYDGIDLVVFDTREGRALYDSRLLP